jgi:outer membrane protein assembly factor BamB
MTFQSRSRIGAASAVIALCTAWTFAQTGPPANQPLRTTPTETLTVSLRFRDWGPTTIAGSTILAGNPTNRGGLFAVDTSTGKLKWTFQPVFSGTASVSTAPAVSGDVVITPFAMSNPGATIAVSLATGKELWRGPDPAVGAQVAVSAGVAFVRGKDNTFYALDAATGREKWKMAFARESCFSLPVVRGGTVYVGGNVLVTPTDASKAASQSSYLFALDANTGQQRWRYPETPAGLPNVCLSQPIVTADTYFAIGGASLYAVNLTTGRERWTPFEVRRPVDGRVRAVLVHGLVDAGPVLVGLTSGYLMAFDKASGQTTWEISGQYRETSPSTAVAGRVLYFQGHPGAPPTSQAQGPVYSGGRAVVQAPPLPGARLNALDLDTRTILWSFSRPTAEANWPFGYVTPFDGGLWVDSYQALVKLQ